jgi:hypothetical protein
MSRVDPTQILCDALAAIGPHPSLIEQAGTYNWLVGAWDAEVYDSESDGAKRVTSAEWYFAWVLEGYAMQDVFIAPRREDRHGAMPVRGNRYGTSLRIFDAALGAWRIYWFNPVVQRHLTMTAKQEGNDIVQRGTGPDGLEFRWTYTKIDADHFRWRSEQMLEDGTSKILVQCQATRRRE